MSDVGAVLVSSWDGALFRGWRSVPGDFEDSWRVVPEWTLMPAAARIYSSVASATRAKRSMWLRNAVVVPLTEVSDEATTWAAGEISG